MNTYQYFIQGDAVIFTINLQATSEQEATLYRNLMIDHFLNTPTSLLTNPCSPLVHHPHLIQQAKEDLLASKDGVERHAHGNMSHGIGEVALHYNFKGGLGGDVVIVQKGTLIPTKTPSTSSFWKQKTDSDPINTTSPSSML